MVSVDGLLDREAGAVLLTALGAATAPCGPDDHRSSGQRRADALVDICGHALDTGTQVLPAECGHTCWSPPL